jgi:putative endonuclease
MTALSRRAAYTLGLRAETIAALYLRLKGYRVLARRYASPVGEIDLVAKKGDTLVFVEVKARATLDAAAESIRLMQQARIVRGAEAYLSRHPSYVNHFLRFDAVLIAPGRLPRHLKSAFDADR